MRFNLLAPTAAAMLFVATVGPALADEFLQQEGNMWRASKLVGVNLFGPDSKKVGSISDVLTGKDGKIGYVVVGVGGFLGIGQKDVAIPFEKVKFSQEPMAQPAAVVSNAAAPGLAPPAGAPAAGGTAPGGMPANTGMAPNSNVGLGTPAPVNGAPGTAPAGGANAVDAMTTPAAPRSLAYPDHGMIDYTADQLKAAPSFAYAK